MGLPLLVVALVASASSFAPCEEALRRDADSRAAAECFWKAGSAPGSRDEAIRRLANARQHHPASGWVTFYLAELQSTLRPAESIDLYRLTLETFARRSDAVGETEARIRLGAVLFAAGRREEAWAEAPHLLASAPKSGDTTLVVRAMLYAGDLAQNTGERLAYHLRLLEEARALVFPHGPFNLKRRVLGGLGKLSFDLGRYEESRAHYEALLALAQTSGDRALAFRSSYNALTARRKQMEELPEPDRLPGFVAAARQLVTLAAETEQPRLQSMAYRTLGDLLWSNAAARREALTHYRNALAHARETDDVFELTMALWALGRVLTDSDAAGSKRLIDEALVRAVDSGNANIAAYAWREHMRLAWKTLARDRAAAESIRALDAIEAQRLLQDADIARAAVLGAWTPDYHWLIGSLLNTDSPTRAEIGLAFQVAERMRARLLLDTMPARAPQAAARTPAALAREQILREISAVQSRLLDPRLSPSERDAAIVQLERLEGREEAARAQLTSSSDAEPPPAVVALERVERALREDEALLTFSVGVETDFYGESAGGGWLLVSTRRGTRVVRVADRLRLEAMIAVFRGLAEESAERTAAASAALHRVLLGQALQTLPSTVTRLIVVADGPLHHVPLTALRNGAASTALGATYEIAVAPSASVWMRLREQRSPSALAGVLVVADPDLPAALVSGEAAQQRGWASDVLRLGRLPYARTEGRSVISHVGEGRLLEGAAATEAAVKSIELRRFGIVHFAAHALVDEVRPDRSAIVLAAGTPDEDGLLQAREVADLPLSGRLAVLSACRSATGAVLAGEGVLGLSHAFFQAGARAVIGTLWAIRDDHAAVFFDAFYAALRNGRSLGGAMLDARRSAIANGLPVSAWSSVVVIGDDSLVLSRRVAPARVSTVVLILAAVIVVAAALGTVVRRIGGRGRNSRSAVRDP